MQHLSHTPRGHELFASLRHELCVMPAVFRGQHRQRRKLLLPSEKILKNVTLAERLEQKARQQVQLEQRREARRACDMCVCVILCDRYINI